jgi:hypothetical protein
MDEGGPHSREEDARESKKSSWEPTAIVVAAIGAIGVISAAVIGLLKGDDHSSANSSPSIAVSTTSLTGTTSATVAGSGQSPPNTISSTSVPVSGSMDQVMVNEDRKKVSASGRADPTVRFVNVLIGPKPVPDQYWSAGGLPAKDGSWSVSVDIDPRLPSPYEVRAFYYTGEPFVMPSPSGEPSADANDLAGPGQAQQCDIVRELLCLQQSGQPSVYNGT